MSSKQTKENGMSKTYKDLRMLDSSKAKKQERKVSVRFKTERKRKDDKRFYAFTTWIERTASKD
jgi:hypothetical protein